MFGLGPMELAIVGVIAVLLFGKRLPEVAKSMGKSFTEFKKGMRGIEDEIHSSSSYSAPSSSSYSNKYAVSDEREEATAPKFEPPTEEPQAVSSGSEETSSTTTS